MLPDPARPLTPRAAVRRKVFHPAWLRMGTQRHRAHVLNLSDVGACVHARCTHRPWGPVTLELDGGDVPARVTWAEGDRCGIKFLRPLTAAELARATS